MAGNKRHTDSVAKLKAAAVEYGEAKVAAMFDRRANAERFMNAQRALEDAAYAYAIAARPEYGVTPMKENAAEEGR